MLILLLGIWRKCTNTQTSIIPYRQPNHPLPSPYRCRYCGSTNLLYQIVQPGNRNGNIGRPYYVCVNPHCSNVTTQGAGQHARGWVTWDDTVGVAPGNPLCNCQRSARQDAAGAGSAVPGRGFWTCSTGACNYISWRRDGMGGWGDEF